MVVVVQLRKGQKMERDEAEGIRDHITIGGGGPDLDVGGGRGKR